MTALPAVTAPRNGWTLSTPTGMWTVYAASLCKPLRSITRSGANATVITSVPSYDLIAVFPKDDSTKTLIRQAVMMLNTASQTVESLRLKMDQTAATLPEYPVVMAMNGVGPSLGPQLMAEIGDVLTAFAGVDPGKNDSGKRNQKSVRTSKKGSPHLRKTLFQIMDGLIKRSPGDDPVYAFMDKKRSEGKPYYVYMTAGANKFLRIYYGRVREYLASLEESKGR